MAAAPRPSSSGPPAASRSGPTLDATSQRHTIQIRAQRGSSTCGSGYEAAEFGATIVAELQVSATINSSLAKCRTLDIHGRQTALRQPFEHGRTPANTTPLVDERGRSGALAHVSIKRDEAHAQSGGHLSSAEDFVLAFHVTALDVSRQSGHYLETE